MPEETFIDTKRAPFTCQGIRSTTSAGKLSATVLGWPEGGTVLIRSLGSDLTLSTHDIPNGRIAWVWAVGMDASAGRAGGPVSRAEVRGGHSWVLRIA